MRNANGLDDYFHKLINFAKTPFFFSFFVALISLATEIILGVLANYSTGSDRTILLTAMIVIPVLVFAMVCILAFFKRNILGGTYSTDSVDKKASASPPDIETPSMSTALAGQRYFPGPHQIYPSFRDAIPDIVKACKEATDVKVFAIKGLVFIGTDESLISTAEINEYRKLSRLRVLLMSPKSKWIQGGFLKLRKYESESAFINEITASHLIAESGIKKIANVLNAHRFEVSYFRGCPCWRMVITENTAFVSSYADDPQIQVQDLTMSRFDNVPGSFYSAYKRYFNEVWHQEADKMMDLSNIDHSVSAGGIVYSSERGEKNVLLLLTNEGTWVLPKGHKYPNEKSLEETALREVSEETGIPEEFLEVEELLETYTDTTFKNEPKVVHLFSIRFLGNDRTMIRPDEIHEDAKWWPIREELPIMKYSYQATVLAEFIDFHMNGKNEGGSQDYYRWELKKLLHAKVLCSIRLK